MMIGIILVKTLIYLLTSPLCLACWRGMINLIYIEFTINVYWYCYLGTQKYTDFVIDKVIIVLIIYNLISVYMCNSICNIKIYKNLVDTFMI